MAGMTEEEFWATTPKYFYYRQKAYERNMQERWEVARYTAWITISPHVKKGMTMKRLGLFAWEKPKARTFEVDQEELKRFSESADRLILGDAINKRS